MRGSEEDWWFKFQNDDPPRSYAPAENRADDSKRTMVKRFLHSSVYKVRERADPPRGTGFTLKATKSMIGKPQLQPSQAAPLSRSQMTKSLRSCASSARFSLFDRPVASESSKRVVCISGLANLNSMASTVALVCGGPLEKIEYHDGAAPSVDIHFLRPDSARRFYDWAGRTSLLAMNGYSLSVDWAAPPSGMTCHAPLALFVVEEVETVKASRVIVLTKAVTKRSAANANSKGYPDARDHFSPELCIERVKWDFVQFGGIVEVTPMVSSKLSFSIQYTDIRSAILAMHTLAQRGSGLNKKYGDYSARYARDVTCRPCLEL
ncbi:hypothetical protein OXX59_006273 [Metschnikowia pulcherrima]